MPLSSAADGLGTRSLGNLSEGLKGWVLDKSGQLWGRSHAPQEGQRTSVDEVREPHFQQGSRSGKGSAAAVNS